MSMMTNIARSILLQVSDGAAAAIAWDLEQVAKRAACPAERGIAQALARAIREAKD